MTSLAPQRSMPPSPLASDQHPPEDGSRPHPWEMVWHPITTVRFMNALRRDPRISRVRKLLYVGPILVLLVALLLPESIVAAGVALLLPLVGPLVNLPVDAALDWFVIGLAAYGLLGVLPRRIVREHHARLFHPRR
jgi:hypothetical protein